MVLEHIAYLNPAIICFRALPSPYSAALLIVPIAKVHSLCYMLLWWASLESSGVVF